VAEDLAVIGKKETHDKQIADIVTGRLDYAADNLPGKKLFTRVLGASHAHARVKSIDTTKAMALDGVKAICTYEDCPVFSQTILYHGQEVAAVAAVDEAVAAQAVELIEVEYETLPFVLDPDEAMKPKVPLVGAYPSGNVIKTAEIIRGDVEAGFTQADIIVEETLGWTNYFQHGTIEPCTAVAHWAGDELYIWTCSQNPFNQRTEIAQALELPMNKVHLVSHGTGSGHGDKHFSEWCIVAAILARKAGQPVQFALSRAENFVIRTHQFPVKATIKIGAKGDGTITAIDTAFYGDVCSNGWPLVAQCSDPIRFTYRCPNGSFKGYSVVTNKPEVGYWRCIAHAQSTYVTEAVIDMLADRLGMNPLDFRLKNIVTPDMPDQDSGKPLSSNGLRDILERLADAIAWNEKWHKPGTRALADGRMHGVGISAHVDLHGSLSVPVGAIINLTKDGKALILSGIGRAGGGTISAHAHIVAETLGMNYEDVTVGDWGNTDVCSDGGFQGGSTRTVTLGAAFQMAAEDARAQLLLVAQTMLGVSADQLDAREGKIFERANPSNYKTHAEVASKMTNPIVGRGYTWSRQLRRPVAGFDVGTPCEVRGVSGAACEVAVDTETGEVEILSFANAVDMGRAIFWKGCENQIEGGLEIMLGEALLYEQILDPVTGATLNTDYVDNRWPTTLDLHTDRHRAILVESDDACGPYGCKGMGEPPVSNYGAIASAIYSATGKWIGDPPIYPEKILRALGKV
jgi:CO/xanthine dehydrogenase Mo-binding subunit